MARSLKGVYSPKNPEKYIGNHSPIWRSTWELAVMRMADNHPSVIHWASEPYRIPYYNPVSRKNTVYVPDFLLIYEDKTGKRKAELVEVKPKKETYISEAKRTRDKLVLAINKAKWKAAQAWAGKNGMSFRVITESDIFVNK